ncbi:S8 family serine peptidase [Paractinoplanes globisporus]|uniref:S8 family serine peptidase n=1 Tax=Paractinoplanes globisporus TaxID=113565 RepID=A0ABW6WXH3_9ACTN|nr:S8 family serine peptidase [Actinoplanes globisporus]
MAAALGVAPTPASAAPPPPPAPGQSYTVTLLTGDVVTVSGGPGGCPAVSVRPVAKSGVLNRSCGPDGHVHVVPAQVAPLLGKVLDPDLFDVTTLILDGYDDARTKDLPLIVRPGASPARLAATPLLAGSRSLPSLGAIAGRRAKTDGAALIRSVSAGAATLRSAAPAAKIWLDRPVRATALDTNLIQISAPQAWKAGYTGVGAKVAVLDTGIDATHPDLAGQIAETKDFTVDGGDAVDHVGHGTHVAATIAGTGAASGGARTGVAPGARLVVGKVLGDDGSGTDSQVIEGMEWAATRAPVVNMSLGGWEPSDGSDPLSLALDTLSGQTGTLFVVAAGNDGPGDSTVSSPAAAASALTVGAVDGDDVVADFSSRGPLVGSHAAKPELVAPGVDIVAARAAGTTEGRPIDDRYVAASGTSMATPHVAAAAAILAQRHPSWTGAQLKAALIGAADPIAGGDPYTSGAGRLNVARALSGVVAGPALSWVNTGAAPAAVALDVAVRDHSGVTAPAGAATLSQRRLTLAAGATGAVTLSIDRSGLKPGYYSAWVTARVGGAVVTRTPIAFEVEAPSHDLTVETTAIPGTPAGADGYVILQVVNLDDPAVFSEIDGGDPGSTITVRVPDGRYSVMASFMSYTDDEQWSALAGDPDVAIGGDTTMRLDLSAARPVTASVAGVDTTPTAIGLTYYQAGRRGQAWNDFAFGWGDAARNVFVVPNDGAAIGTFRTYGGFGLRAANGDVYDLVHAYGNGIPADPAYRVGPAEKAGLARIDQHFHQVDIPDSVTGHKRYGFSPEGMFVAENETDDVSGYRTDYVTPGVTWIDEAFWNGVVSQEGLRTYRSGSRQEKTWLRQPLRSDFFDDPAGSPSGCVPAQPSRTSGNMHVELVTLVDRHGRFDCLQGGFGLDLGVTLSLSRDGRPIGEVNDSIADFAVPKQAGAYRLTFDVDASGALPVSTRTTTQWTFRSSGPSGTGSTPLPLLSVDYNLPLDAANHPLASGQATFSVLQSQGVRPQVVTDFKVSVSLDGGATWLPAAARRTAAGVYRAQLPQPAAGQTVSLRVAATGSAGSGIEQTIIDAYRAA